MWRQGVIAGLGVYVMQMDKESFGENVRFLQ